MTANGERDPYYGRERRWAALLLVVAAIALVLWDAYSTSYEANLGIVGLLLGTAAIFLGVEPFLPFLKRPDDDERR